MEEKRSLSILVIDDAVSIQRLLTRHIINNGHTCHATGTLQEASGLMDVQRFDMIFLDIFLPDGNGLDFITVCRKRQESPPLVVVITGSDDLNSVEEAMMAGAWDFLQKPFDGDRLAHILNRARAVSRLVPKTKRDDKPTTSIIGESPAIQKALQTLWQAADKDVNVLISGASGTGKELFAHELHQQGDLADHPFVIVDCAVLPESLFESILFGHVKGAFTGAVDDRTGLILQAEKGTLFLDEIGELPLEVQKKFLRVLQERTVSPLGGKKSIPVNFRLICATNRNLSDMVKQGSFRLDLYHRISAFPIHLPAIKDRQDDIVLLARFFMEKLCKQHQATARELSHPFIEAIQTYDWPGNVRELKNILEQVILTTSEKTLYPDHLPKEIRTMVLKKIFAAKREHQDTPPLIAETVVPQPVMACDLAHRLAQGLTIPSIKSYRQDAVDQAEKHYLEVVLSHTRGNTAEAIAISGIAKSQFYRLMKKYQLS